MTWKSMLSTADEENNFHISIIGMFEERAVHKEEEDIIHKLRGKIIQLRICNYSSALSNLRQSLHSNIQFSVCLWQYCPTDITRDHHTPQGLFPQTSALQSSSEGFEPHKIFRLESCFTNCLMICKFETPCAADGGCMQTQWYQHYLL